jgi:hypothetical protein
MEKGEGAAGAAAFTVSDVGTIETPTERARQRLRDENHLHQSRDECGPQSP